MSWPSLPGLEPASSFRHPRELTHLHRISTSLTGLRKPGVPILSPVQTVLESKAETKTILIVEDEASIASAIGARLRSEGFEVEIASDGPTAVQRCEAIQPDLVVLDLMLPGFGGHEVCRRIQRDRPVPVLMLTARDSEGDLIEGLAVGADDYMTKPFSARELVARVQALLRRAARADALAEAHPHADGAEHLETAPLASVQLGVLSIDGARRRVHNAGEEVHLTPIEFELLHYLATRPGAVATRAQLLSEVWGYPDVAGARTIDSHVRALRRKLGADMIRTVHGVGYALEASAA